MTEEPAVTTLTKALAGAEAGRRVGWARNYTAEGRLDEALRDQEELRVQRDVLRRAASFLFGFVHAFGPGVAGEALQKWRREAVEQILDPDVIRAGREAAEVLITKDVERTEAREARRSGVRREAKQSGRLFKNAREQERKMLVDRFGFPNEAAFLNYLSEYDGPRHTT